MAEKEYSLEEALRLVGIGILVYKSLENGGAAPGLRFEADLDAEYMEIVMEVCSVVDAGNTDLRMELMEGEEHG